VLVAVALAFPLLPALSGSSLSTSGRVVIWAGGALPALLIAAVAARRPRTASVVAGIAVVEAAIALAAPSLLYAFLGGAE
jgi:hypothetical protein